MTNPPSTKLELEDIQAGVLQPRPDPYVGTYIGLRIDDRKAGRDFMRSALGVVNSAADAASKTGESWVSISLTHQGLKALGVLPVSLDNLDPVFQQAGNFDPFARDAGGANS
jgi:deferrochelatase/peroxidase EfeB